MVGPSPILGGAIVLPGGSPLAELAKSALVGISVRCDGPAPGTGVLAHGACVEIGFGPDVEVAQGALVVSCACGRAADASERVG